MRPTKHTHKNILSIIIPSFVLILLWIGLTIYRSRVTSDITQTQSVQIRPIAATFDTATIEQLKQRQQIAPILMVTPIVEEEIASDSAEIEQFFPDTPSSSSATTGSQSATQGSQL